MPNWFTIVEDSGISVTESFVIGYYVYAFSASFSVVGFLEFNALLSFCSMFLRFNWALVSTLFSFN